MSRIEQVLGTGLFIAIAVIFIISQSVYTVNERQKAILLQLGQPIGDVKEPGLHFKLPIIQNVRTFDTRILSVDPAPAEMVISSSSLIEQQIIDLPEGEEGEETASLGDVTNGEPILVDMFARYRITDPLAFLKTLRTQELANQRLNTILNDTTRATLGNSTLRDILSPKRTEIMETIRTRMNESVQRGNLGIEIVDARIVRADLTQNLLEATVRRMNSELQERAAETRAQGEEIAIEIRSDADKERTVILAEANRDAQIIKGQGDREATEIYANAFNKDREFYAFLRSMEAYRNTLADPDSAMILSPDSAFLKYLQNLNP